MWVWQHRDNPGWYWDAENARWTDCWNATYYRGCGPNTPNSVPTGEGGSWCALWNVDSFQFPRLIAEIAMVEAVDADGMQRLCESMDNDFDSIKLLFSRAVDQWEKLIDRLPD